MAKKDDDDPIWETRDGREIPLSEMHTPHVGLAHNKLKDWLKGESDPVLRRDLASWKRRFLKELKARREEYLNARKRGA